MIRLYGNDLQHKKYTVTDLGDGEKEISYVIQEPKRGQVTEVTPFDEQITRWGTYVEADYIVTFLPGTDVKAKDLLLIEEADWCEILDISPRSTKGITDYLEAHLRRRGK